MKKLFFIRKTKVLFLVAFVILNLIVIFLKPAFAKEPQRYGQWATRSCTSGTIVDYWCEESQLIECTVGETGRGYCP